MTYTENDAWAYNCYREARNQGYLGMRCVAWVTQNVADARRLSILATIELPNEFSWTIGLPRNPDGSLDLKFPPASDPQWCQARKIVADIVSGADKDDPTDGAHFYANLDAVRAANKLKGLPEESGWFFRHIVLDHANHPETVQVLQHTFYV